MDYPFCADAMTTNWGHIPTAMVIAPLHRYNGPVFRHHHGANFLEVTHRDMPYTVDRN
ncbi:hypothetical protein [Bradyrhizobium sp. CCBAU 051011]|uniref:hypothetical protein n=1 Tax=Bradyrhizobium sp. CCBAU 051011 TaxID=858422 RepID=UPI00137A5705|nr:hypothetical protein [Bradyrhizobium sp. CCBAU 051011]